ncbi:hypothetical protein BGZ83_000398 [Gryganskiella cystojenkinii]|nr:hypothetical protein BGZ83_000398 [Gryganskiella cystojenkinii]
MSSHSHSHGQQAHGQQAHGQQAHGTTNATVNALSASVLPVATAHPGANVAHSLATAPGEAPSTIPSKAGLSAPEGKNKVIVVFKSHTPAAEIEAAIKDCEAQGGKITQRYTSALLGFAAEVPDGNLQTLTVHPHVDYVEPDGEVSIYGKKLLSKK